MIYVIVGPTGSGKTSIACHIAQKYNIPIINADAFQIYQEMNIGTAKINKNDPLYQKHFLIDIINPSETYSVKQYQDDFLKVYSDLSKANNDILVCGGTGLYLRAALYDYSFPEQEEIDASKYESLSNEELYEMLLKLDRESAIKIHPNNRKRVIRALIIAENNSVTKSENEALQEHKMRFEESDVKILFLNPDRDYLYRVINSRVDKMFDNGLVEEVKELLNKYHFSTTAYQAIGYKEVIDYLNNLTTLEECKELIKKRTRNYAKRQVTFFKHQFNTIEFKDRDSLIEFLENSIEKNI